MQDHQEDIINMHETVDGVLIENNGIWSINPKVSPIVAKFRAQKTEMHALRLIQDKPRTGAALDKQAIATDLINAVIIVRDGVQAHAKETENNELFKSVHFTDSELKSCRDNILADHANVVHSVADPLFEILDDYYVTRADIELILTLRTQYLLAIDDPRNLIIKGKGATHDLALKFTEMAATLDTLDYMIKPFNRAHHDFVQQYFNARIIVDSGHRKSGTQYAVFSATITDSETDLPLTGATFRVVEANLTTTSDPSGKCRINLKKEGIYSIQVLMPNYISYTESNIQIKIGSEINFEIELDPEPPAEV